MLPQENLKMQGVMKRRATPPARILLASAALLAVTLPDVIAGGGGAYIACTKSCETVCKDHGHPKCYKEGDGRTDPDRCKCSSDANSCPECWVLGSFLILVSGILWWHFSHGIHVSPLDKLFRRGKWSRAPRPGEEGYAGPRVIQLETPEPEPRQRREAPPEETATVSLV